MGPADISARGGHLVFTQCRPVRRLRALLVGRAPADDRLAADNRRAPRLRPGLLECHSDRVGVVPQAFELIDTERDIDESPNAVTLETISGEVVAEDVSFGGDAVVVVQEDELAQTQGTGERAGLVRDPLHQAAVADEHVRMVIDDFMPGPVVARREITLAQRHADGIRQPLSQRSGRGLHPHLRLIFGVTGGPPAKLTEIAQLVDRNVVA